MPESTARSAYLSLSSVASELGVHPFTVARVLGHSGELPPGLRFAPADVLRTRELAGLEMWWKRGEVPASAVGSPVFLRLLARKMVRRQLIEGRWTLGENLVRGLMGGARLVGVRVVNEMIRHRTLLTRSNWRGPEATVAPDARAQVSTMAEGGPIPVFLREAVR